MRKPFFSVVHNKASENGRIDIYGEIGSSWWYEGNDAKKFVRELAVLEAKYDRIDIHINSPGGSVWDGLAIFNAIRASKKDIHTYVDGIAFSMGAVIALAGHTVHAAKGSLMMLHNASGSSWGNAKKMRLDADVLDTHDAVLSQLIADRTGKTVEEVESLWMNYEDNFLSSTDALKEGLIDVIEDYAAKDAPDDAQNMTMHQLVAFYNDRSEEPSDHLVSKIFNQVKNKLTPMKFPELLALAGVENATADQLSKANADLAIAGITNLTIVQDSIITDAAAVTEKNTQLTSDLEAANAAKTTAETDLATATARIASLEAENTVLKKGPGAKHKAALGEDEVVETEEDQEMEDLISNMAHNREADSMIY